MQVIIIDRSNLSALKQLLADGGGPGGALEQLKSLNPHVDFENVASGTVLFLPGPLATGGLLGPSLRADGFEALRTRVLASVDAVRSRVSDGYAALQLEAKAVSREVNAAILAAPDLERRIKDSIEIFSQDEQEFQSALTTLRTLNEQAVAELNSLAQMPT
jgi:hypothetical protein